MALVAEAMVPGITAAFTSGVEGAGSDEIATAIATAYDLYAKTAQSCSGLTPTLVQLADLQSGLKDALSDSSQTALESAKLWAAAAESYWTGALFGVTGLVVATPGTAALEVELGAVFGNVVNTLPSAAQQIATALDKFTKLVAVKDSVLPIPTGCGPSPIS